MAIEARGFALEEESLTESQSVFCRSRSYGELKWNVKDVVCCEFGWEDG